VTKIEFLQTIVAVGGGIIGAVGGTIGIVTTARSNRRELQREIDEENDFNFLAAFMQKQLEVSGHAGQIFTELDIGSLMWKRAEKMIERGVLERGPQGRGYRIRGFEGRRATSFRRQEKKAPEIEGDRRL
jgi:hypothetical protein